ncbi:hypothetical protein JGUZn3_08770 [Entomobacter blattae]|uniref:Uncharacterized protein n=1 Tax=Entomobacter blattae TaxID=2762277 RepID=A0A7H1NQP9_9PROT|nr:hypothetical protein JGUZn3_08770 [Entomobacter blattae]
MSRRHRAVKREILPDLKFGDVVSYGTLTILFPAQNKGRLQDFYD